MGSTRLQETPLIDFRITLTGTAPLIMHSNRLSDPLHPATKEYKKITGKRQKTEDDHLEIARMEHAASIYFDPDVGPYIPGENLSRALVDAARITRKGKMVERGVFISTDIEPAVVPGPADDRRVVGRRELPVTCLGHGRHEACDAVSAGVP
jgi:hypothetical protein